MAGSIVRTLLISGAAAGLMAAAGACSCSIGSSSSHAVGKNDVASQISTKMTGANGTKPDSVTCPSDLPAKVGAQINCTMKVKDETFTVNVTVTSVDGSNVKFDMVKIVDKSRIATVISDKLYEQSGDRPASVTCPDDLKVFKGSTLRCVAAGQVNKYGVNVTVTDTDGDNYHIDIKVDDEPLPS